MRVEWTDPALYDLESAIEYIAEDSEAAARRIARRIRERVEGLADLPRTGRPGRIEGTRELVVSGTPFIVAYWLRDEAVEILAVHHSARQWPDSF